METQKKAEKTIKMTDSIMHAISASQFNSISRSRIEQIIENDISKYENTLKMCLMYLDQNDPTIRQRVNLRLEIHKTLNGKK